MRKAATILAVISILGFGIFAASSHAQKMMTKGWNAYEVSRLLNYGVVNRNGQSLGRIQDFITDSDGRIAFAIISKPGFLGIRGKPVAVPFETLFFASEKNEFVLNMSWKKFSSMPDFNKRADLENPAWAADIYRYFGVQPYWTEEGQKRNMDPYRWGGEAQDF